MSGQIFHRNTIQELENIFQTSKIFMNGDPKMGGSTPKHRDKSVRKLQVARLASQPLWVHINSITTRC